MYCLKFALASLIIGALFFSFTCCNHTISDKSNVVNIRDFEYHKIDSIITHNNRTIIYLWTEWCDESCQHFTEDVAPYLQQKPDSIGFVSIFYGNKNELKSILMESQCLYPTFRIKSRGGLDNIRIHKLLNLLLDDYKLMHHVPVSIICDKNGNILNYSEGTKEYSHIDDCILCVGGNVKSY